jgi:hypothetical protein
MLDWLRSFTDEIKTAASQGRLTIPKVRQGRRSMTVATLLRKEKEGTLYKEAFDEHIPGGLAAGKKPSQFNAKSLAQGRRVEREHTTSNEIATEISMDHLTEDPHYYRKLIKMEKESEYKAAVSIAGMQQAYQRLGAIRVKPTKGSFGNVVGDAANSIRDMVANGPATIMPKRVASKLKATIPSFLTEGLDPEELAELTGGVQQQISAAKNVAKQYGGKILMTPGGGYRTFRNVAGIPGMEGSSFAEGTGSMLRGVSPEGKKAINLATGLHESYERAAKQHQQFGSHFEPAVIYNFKDCVAVLLVRAVWSTTQCMLRTAIKPKVSRSVRLVARKSPKRCARTFNVDIRKCGQVCRRRDCTTLASMGLGTSWRSTRRSIPATPRSSR